MKESNNEALIIPPNFENYSHSSSDAIIPLNNYDLLNYRGYFVDHNPNQNDDEPEQRFYEFGAHFPYYFLVQKLEILKLEQSQSSHHPLPPSNPSSLLDGLNLKQNPKSRNRNTNFNIHYDNAHIIDRFSAIPKDKINNDEKTKQPNNDAISIILKESSCLNENDNNNKDLNTKTEIITTYKKDPNDINNNEKTNNKSVKAYTSFANKLKEAKRCNKGRNVHNATDLPCRKNSTQINGNVNVNGNGGNKNKTLQMRNGGKESGGVSQDVIMMSKQKNKLEKKIKHSANSANNNNVNINNNKQNDVNANVNVNRNKSKEFSTSSNKNIPNSKIATSINNLLTSYKYKRNMHFSPGLHPQPTKIIQKGNNVSNINNNNTKTMTQVKILTKNKIQDFITSLSKTSKQKSRNFNTHNTAITTMLKNNVNNNNRTILTSHTKSNAQTDREKTQKLLIGNNNEKARSASNKIRNVKGKFKSNKYKTYIDIKFNVFNKTNQQLINEIKGRNENNNESEHQRKLSRNKNGNTLKGKSNSKTKSTKSHKVLKSNTGNESSSNNNNKVGCFKIK